MYRKYRDFRKNLGIISRYYNYLVKQTKNHKPIGAFNEWILDNYATLLEHQNMIEEALSDEKLVKQTKNSSNVIWNVLNIYLDNNNYKMSQKSMFRHLKSYQKHNKISFTYQELLLIRPILSMIIVQKVKELCLIEKDAFLEKQKAEEDIVFLGEKLLKHPKADIHKYIEIKEDIIEHPIYVEYLNENLYRLNSGASQLFYDLNENLERNNTNLKKVLYEVHQDRIKNNLVISNLFTILKMNENLKLETVIEEISETEEELNSDKIYKAMDNDTKNRYRTKLMKNARKQGIHELTYARRLLAQSQKEKKHIGFYLLKEPNIKLREILYLLAVILSTTFISWFLAPYLTNYQLLGVLLLWIPTSEIIITILNRFLTSIMKPESLPKMDCSKGLQEEQATAVVIPTILRDKKKIDEMYDNLESGYLANKSRHLYFVLLGDCSEQKQATVAHDDEVAEYGLKKSQELNKKYNSEIFFFAYRKRVWHESENSYLGWERKRGALIHFNRLLLNKMSKTDIEKYFQVENITNIPDKIKYVITLDADTKLVVDTVSGLVGTISHPLNEPVLNKERNKVISGYGIISPKLSVDVESSNKSVYAEIFAGLGGFDVYNTLVSNFYQDVFHEGSFMGKGIYNLQVFDEVIDHRFPTGLILSHDLVESNYLHSGYTSNIELFDDFCSRYLTDMTRHHRWMRGDVQVLPWLLPFVKDENGKRYRNPLTLIEKWKLFDNLRRCLIELSLLIILLLSYFSSRINLTGWCIYILLVIAMPLVFYITEKLNNQFTRKVKVKPYTNIIKSGEAIILRTIITFTTLPYKAWLYVNAILKSTYRMLISKKNLLNWLTAEEAEKTVKNTLTNYIDNFKPNYLVICILLLFTYFFGENPNFLSALCISFTFSLAPYITYCISREKKTHKKQLDELEEKEIKGLAYKTWKFFDENLTEENNYLIPDNYQNNREYKKDKKTSPTDIAYSLLSVVAAYELDFIEKNKCINYLDKIITSVEKLEKWNGHLYNWYHTESLKILFPHFVSSVDSGNFVACLIVVKEFLYKLKEEKLALRFVKLIDETDFSKLYTKEHVFSVGYNDYENELSIYRYNRFASESRLMSYVAIAKGDVPSKHWFCLDKTLTKFKYHKGVASWAGSLFEYYMPLIFMKSYHNTLLDESYDFSYYCQKAYMHEINPRLPWGISECAYDELDNGVNYKYKTFSIPYLKLQEVEDTRIVISPYSSLLVITEKPKEVYKNYLKFKKLNMVSDYGLYESYDTSTKRPVQTYFSHHQGMILASITNYLTDGVIQDYFMNDTNNKAFEILTKEKIQLNPVIDWKIAKYKRFNYQKEVVENDMRYFTHPSDLPEVSAISNSKYTVLMNDRGNGFSRYKEIQLNRYRKVTEQDYGTFLYLKDLDSKKIWSNTYAPINKKPEKYEVVFASDRIKYVLVENDIATTTEIIVSTTYNAEIRKITLKNNSKNTKKLELTTYLEPTVTENINDVTHRTFNNLFLESEYNDDLKALIMKKTLRNKSDRYYFLHRLLVPNTLNEYEYETRRINFIGRDRTASNPIALTKKLSNQAGTPIDPVMSIRNVVELAPEQSREVYIINSFGTSRNQVIDVAKYYENINRIEDEFFLATFTNVSNMKKLNITGSDMRLYNIMLNYLYQTSKTNISEERKTWLKANTLSQEGLWKFGISGDRPMITITVHDISSLSLAKQVLKAYEYFKSKGIFVDIIIIASEKKPYEKNIKEELDFVIYQINKTNSFGNRPGNIYYINHDELTKEEETLLNTVARLRLDSREHESLRSYIDSLQANNSASTYQEIKKQELLTVKDKEKQLEYFNGYGGFTKDGKEYVITNNETPTPWFNIIANKNFGTLVSNNASGFTYAYNSQDFKITSWTNDIVSFDQSEGIRINKESFHPSITRHGFGYTIFESETEKYEEKLTEFVASLDKIKFYILEIKNKSEKAEKINLSYWLNPVLGNLEEKTSRYLLCDEHLKENYFTIRNVYSKEYHNNLIFVSTTEEVKEIKTNKILIKSLDTEITLAPKETKKIVFFLGVATNEEEVKTLLNKYKTISAVTDELKQVKDYWQQRLGTIQVKTKDSSFNHMINGWYLYQTIVGRITARAGFYQVSGAFGYRDQLQDTTNICMIEPELTKNQIIKNAKHQFKEGDVLHWWLEPKNFGLRSRFKDDYLWLVYATSEYIKVTNDTNILKEEIPFVQGEVLQDFEDERGVSFTYSEETASLYEHCRLAIERTLNDLGNHGLPRMGGGDWNDGMNKIGIEGFGESVWLGFFFYELLERFIELSNIYDKKIPIDKYKQAKDELKNNLNEKAWDGEYYLRAFFDDGTLVGSKSSEECQIDLISQSFSILSEVVPKDRIDSVLNSVRENLVDNDTKIVRLLTPAFKNSKNYPGYIMDYPVGVRENGGQYTHAVSWYIMALLKVKHYQEAYQIYQMINPVNRTKTNKDVTTYMTEPYVIAADIYSNPDHKGRGGWTWYTGSSGWFYRVGLESILGFKVRGNKLEIDPQISSDFGNYTLTYQYKSTTYEIEVILGKENKITYNGKEVSSIDLIDDNKKHQIQVEVKTK